MANPRVPVFKAVTVTSIGILMDFSGEEMQGAIMIRNAGADEVFMAWEAVPGAATVGDGRFRIKADEAVNIDATQVSSVGFITAALETAVVEAIGLPRPGNAGGGII